MASTGHLSHVQASTGLDPYQRIQASDYHYRNAGENIAAGQNTPEQVVREWLESDEDCANIMQAAYNEVGVGHAPDSSLERAESEPDTSYWTQVFAESL